MDAVEIFLVLVLLAFLNIHHFQPVFALAKLLPELLSCIFPLGGINVTDDHLGTLSEEALGKFQAYPLGPTSYNGPEIRY